MKDEDPDGGREFTLTVFLLIVFLGILMQLIVFYAQWVEIQP
jgi:hypothetical protein